ncbi:hypothetical protein EDD21DRAFT_371448 [Dissophora ornata]|nr:hypothetical protein BGZ58_007052 [Dissophora ornata]KAI8602581.1 hypothetical protein EDD21DRAFT_371448 [Dissophora ornata]
MKLSIIITTLSILSNLFSVSARLTVEEQDALLQSSAQGSPDFCSACLRKAMTNHFPHACSKDMPDPISLASQDGQIKPEIIRCLCVSFIDPMWMKQDCLSECEFVKHEAAMEMIPKVKDFPGCDNWVDLETFTELDVPGYTKRDPEHRPVVYDNEEEEASVPKSLEDIIKEKLEQLHVLEDEDMNSDDGGDENDVPLTDGSSKEAKDEL